MKRLLTSIIILMFLMAFAMTPVPSDSQTDLPPATKNSPISQPLIREGTLAVRLAGDLKLGTTENEAEAEDLLSAAGIAPRNGWIADYPVLPDVVGELQAAVSEAADSGRLSMGKDAALQALQDDVSSYSLPLTPDTTGRITGDMSAPGYPDTTTLTNYYYNEGPPAVTYYAPPPDYAYMYTWVPYPFWWADFWFPGFFVLADFQVGVHWHHHGYEYEGFVTNRFRDRRTGGISRIDPANRFRGGTLPAGEYKGRTGPAPSKEFRGYGLTPDPAGTRSSAFGHSVDRQVEHSASDRGFRSRSSAGQLPAAGRGGGAVDRSGGSHGGGGGFHGGGRR